MIATTMMGYVFLFASAFTAGFGFTLGAKVCGKLVK